MRARRARGRRLLLPARSPLSSHLALHRVRHHACGQRVQAPHARQRARGPADRGAAGQGEEGQGDGGAGAAGGGLGGGGHGGGVDGVLPGGGTRGGGRQGSIRRGGPLLCSPRPGAPRACLPGRSGCAGTGWSRSTPAWRTLGGGGAGSREKKGGREWRALTKNINCFPSRPTPPFPPFSATPAPSRPCAPVTSAHGSIPLAR